MVAQAKKKTPPKKKPLVDPSGQQRIAGTYKKPPKALSDAAAELDKLSLAERKAKDKKDAAEVRCRELMKKHGIDVVEINDEWVIRLNHTEKAARSRKPKPKADEKANGSAKS